jgi:hypothetical protein
MLLSPSALAVGTTAEKSRVDRCVQLIYGPLVRRFPPAARRLYSPSQPRKGLYIFCRAADAEGLLRSDGDVVSGKQFVAFLHAKPWVFRPFCLAIAYVGRGQSAMLERYVEDAGWRTFGTNFCRFAPFYVREDGSVDFRSMMRQHPTIPKPFCVAGFLSAYDENPKDFQPFTRSDVKRRAGHLCVALFRRGIAEYLGGSNVKIHKTPAYYAALREFFGKP